MKVPPKRKGNSEDDYQLILDTFCLNESPSEKEGKFCAAEVRQAQGQRLNESPSEKEGKLGSGLRRVSQ